MAIRTRRGKLYPPVDREFALALGIDEVEWDSIVDRLGRPPNHFECHIFATLWSEAVSNKSSASLLDTIREETSGVREIAGSQLKLLDIGCGQFLALRVVHNNSQTQIEPSYGAQTALDQSLEELATAGARPLGLLSMIRVGNHELVKNQRLFQGVVDGIGGYGNKVGTPLVGGDTYFHERYNRGPLINGGVVGLVSYDTALRVDDVPFKSPVLYIGSPTGKENIAHLPTDLESLEHVPEAPNIKISDPLLENRMLSACAEAIEQGVLQEIVAVGPGGLAVAAFDLASRVGKPVLLDIDRIPIRGNDELKPLQIILSESAQRLLVVTRKEHHRALTNIFYKWDIFNVKVGEVNDSDGIEFYWNHYPAADIPFQFAMEGSIQKEIEVVQFPPMLKRGNSGSDQADKIRRRKRVVDDEWSLVREVALGKDSDDDEREFDCPNDLEDIWLDMLADPNLCSRAAMYQLFDQVVGANTIQRPGGDAAVLRLPKPVAEELPEALHHRGVAITFDSNSLYVSMEPYLGTVQTVAECMRNLAAVGARPIALAHCMNFGNPNNYKEICDLAESVRGLGDASKIWNIPMLSENVSLYNGTDGSPILPTPAILMAGMVRDFRISCRIGFRRKGDKIFLLGLSKNEIGCTEYANYVHKKVNRLVPDIDFDFEQKICESIVDMIEKGYLSSAHDISSGGLAIALTECCMSRSRPIGARLHIDDQVFDTPNGPVPLRRDAALFGESSGRFLVSCPPEQEQALLQYCEANDIAITGKGEVGGKAIVVEGIDELSLPVSTTFRLWSHRMEHLLGHRETQVDLV